MTRFVILAVPRTGSNLLCTLLNSHSQILCHHEIFNPQGVFTARDYHGQELVVESLRQRDDQPLSFLDRVWKSGAGHQCTGFKWTRGQNEQVLKRVVEDSCIRKIVLRRRNRIKTYVSDLIAQKTQQWEVYSRHELTLPRPRIHVDAAELLQHIATNDDFYRTLSTGLGRRNQPLLEVEYEVLFNRHEQVRMLDFLGVYDHSPLTAASVKQNSTDLRDSISNFNELNDHLPNDQLVAELHDRGI